MLALHPSDDHLVMQTRQFLCCVVNCGGGAVYVSLKINESTILISDSDLSCDCGTVQRENQGFFLFPTLVSFDQIRSHPDKEHSRVFLQSIASVRESLSDVPPQL